MGCDLALKNNSAFTSYYPLGIFSTGIVKYENPMTEKCDCDVIMCSYGCGLQIPSCLVEDHRQVCQSKSRFCPICRSGLMTGSEICEHLEKECPYMICPSCRAKLTRAQFASHMENHARLAWCSCTLCGAFVGEGKKGWTHYVRCAQNITRCPACYVSFQFSEKHTCLIPQVKLALPYPAEFSFI